MKELETARDKAIVDKETIKNCWKACPSVWMISSLQKRGLHMISHKKFAHLYIATLTCDFLIVSDCSTHQKENETTIALFLSAQLFLLPFEAACSFKVYQVFFVILSASWLLVRCWRSRSRCWLTCAAMFTACARDEHIMHVHAWWTRGRRIATYIHTYKYSDFLVVLISVRLAPTTSAQSVQATLQCYRLQSRAYNVIHEKNL